MHDEKTQGILGVNFKGGAKLLMDWLQRIFLKAYFLSNYL
jgi:hypothetical protein